MNKWYVLGCSHYSHSNICGPKLSKWTSGFRNFESLEEMNSTISRNINEMVEEDDHLLHFGDFAFGDKKKIPLHRESIKCKNVYLLYGNHDSRIRENEEYQQLFVWCKDYHEFWHHGLLITCMHYPIGSWNGHSRGAINLHSHTHGNYTRTIGRQKDIGVDTNDMKPYSLDILVNEMRKIPVAYIDHHREDTPIY